MATETQCPVSEKTLASKQSLRRHMKIIHKSAWWSCKKCSHQADSKDALNAKEHPVFL